LAAEAGDKNFDAVLKEAKKVWKHKLNKIQVWGGTEEQHRIFYTGLYHNYMAPNLISDVIEGSGKINGTRQSSLA